MAKGKQTDTPPKVIAKRGSKASQKITKSSTAVTTKPSAAN